MSAVGRSAAEPARVTPTWVMALLAMLCPGLAHAALAPAPSGASTQKNDSSTAQNPAAGATTTTPDKHETTWVMPAVRIGGLLRYDHRRDSWGTQSSSQQGLTGTLNASTETFIWQPWFARLNLNLGLSMLRDSSSGNDTFGAGKNSNQSLVLTGDGQLSVLAQSKFPFTAHFQRTDSRVSSDLSLLDSYASQRYGFTQSLFIPRGVAMVGWDRNTQTSDFSGRSLQDILQLNVSQNLGDHRLQLTGNRSSNSHEIRDERAVQNHLSLQHYYAPDPSISIQSLANISRSSYQLQQGDNDTRLLQLNSHAFWRPHDRPMTVTGGVRLFALEVDTTGVAANSDAVGARARNANANLGVNYDLNRFTRINAGVNVNLAENSGDNDIDTSQFLGAAFQPDVIALGDFQYNWQTSATATNRTGGAEPGLQLALQMGHSLGRSFSRDGGSTVRVDVSQNGVLVLDSSSPSATQQAVSTQQLIHNGSLSWDLSKQAGTALVRLSASDSRSLDGNQEFFQLVNLQASSNLPTGTYSSWTGYLTIQAVRQGANRGVGFADPFNPQTSIAPDNGFVTTSNGSISYQNGRVFDVRGLRFVSDLRLNSQALLPLLGSAKDQETAAWSNSIDYAIGRTQLRAQVVISRIGSGNSSADPATGVAQQINKSIMFTIARGFGDF